MAKQNNSNTVIERIGMSSKQTKPRAILLKEGYFQESRRARLFRGIFHSRLRGSFSKECDFSCLIGEPSNTNEDPNAPYSPYETPHITPFIHPPRQQPPPKKRLSLPRPLSLEGWTQMEAVLHWLSKEGICIACHQDKGRCLYTLNNRYISSSQIILIANRLRISMGLRPFLLDTITEY